MFSQGYEYHAIFSYLRSLKFHFSDTWVSNCVNFLRSKNPNISLEQLKDEVKQQWLLLNLREIKVPSLPPDIKLKEKIILNGDYAVQVESILDSSQPYYSQFLKFRKVDLENLEEEPEEWSHKASRCLTFVLCDGVQEIQAMEYQPIQKIRTNDPELLPGFKMVIVGPVECRRGMILLRDENIRVYGGKVDALTVTNTLKNILIRKLQLDESYCLENVSPELQHSAGEGNAQDNRIEELLSQNDEVFLNVPLEPEIYEATASAENLQSQVINDCNLFYLDIGCWSENDLNLDNYTVMNKDSSIASDNLQTLNQQKPSLSSNLESTLPGSVGSQNSLNAEYEKDIFINFKEPQLPVNIKPKKPVQTKLSSFFKNSDISSKSVCNQELKENLTIYVSDKPFVYLKHIMSVKLMKPAVFTIKAIVLTLKKKITIKNDLFNLVAAITDGSDASDVEFCSEILEEFLGFSPSEMAIMMKARQTNSIVAQRIKESFFKAQEKLISLNGLMKVKFFTENKMPVILSLKEVTSEHLQNLRSRSLVAH